MNTEIVLTPENEPIYIKDMTEIIDFNSINDQFDRTEFINNTLNEISFRLDFFNTEQFQGAKRLLELECKNYLNSCFNISDLYDDIILTNSWCNVTKSNQSHHHHTHPFSVVSGIILLDNNIDNLNLNFILTSKTPQIPYFIEHDKQMAVSLKTILDMANIKSENLNYLKNHLVLFLSNLPHFVTPTPENSMPRKSISFNTFWKGLIGNKNDTLSSISISGISSFLTHDPERRYL
jgi:hypothetical protein